MVKKKLIVAATALMISPVAFSTIGSTYVYASEFDQTQQDEKTEIVEQQDTYRTIKNNLYIALEEEIESLDGNISEEKALQLMEKYDGAKVTFVPNNLQPYNVQIASTSHQLVSGGVNSYATNKASMRSLATLFQNAGDAAVVGGIIGGMPNVYAALIASLSSSYLSEKFYTASNIMSQWNNSTALQGGVRITLTDTFPIYHARNITPAVIP